MVKTSLLFFKVKIVNWNFKNKSFDFFLCFGESSSFPFFWSYSFWFLLYLLSCIWICFIFLFVVWFLLVKYFCWRIGIVYYLWLISLFVGWIFNCKGVVVFGLGVFDKFEGIVEKLMIKCKNWLLVYWFSLMVWRWSCLLRYLSCLLRWICFLWMKNFLFEVKFPWYLI